MTSKRATVGTGASATFTEQGAHAPPAFRTAAEPLVVDGDGSAGGDAGEAVDGTRPQLLDVGETEVVIRAADGGCKYGHIVLLVERKTAVCTWMANPPLPEATVIVSREPWEIVPVEVVWSDRAPMLSGSIAAETRMLPT